MKVYLDTNIISRVTDLKLSEEAARAYRLLGENEKVQLVTSSKARQELEKTPNIIRNQILAFLSTLFAKVPDRITVVGSSWGSAPWGSTTWGGGWVDPTLQSLREIFKPDDAQHIFLAAKDNCDYFLTLDNRTILSRARANPNKIALLCGEMRFVSPEEILELVGGLCP